MTTKTPSKVDRAMAFQQARIRRWERVAGDMKRGRRPCGRTYHRRLVEIYRFLVPPGLRVLELGSGTGRLLAAVEPTHGVGLDFSPTMVELAAARHAEIDFRRADVHDPLPEETFDVVILSDLVHDVWDLQRVLERVAAVCHPRTRVILNFSSRLWEPPLAVASGLGLARPVLRQNWFTPPDVANLLDLAGFDVLRGWQEVLLPAYIPFLSRLANRYLVKIWPFSLLGLTNFVMARPRSLEPVRPAKVSVVVAARNEAGNIDEIIRRTPPLAEETEILFVEGGSTDGTWEAIEKAVGANPGHDLTLLKQPGRGKGDAVRHGFSHARGDVLVILDADMTVAPEDLPRFVDALASGAGEFINGVRLVYPMEDRAMRPLNLLGNKFFSLAFSWLLGQPVKDTLCGTKVLWRRDYELIAANRSYFGDFDPYGDFDLLFGAAKLGFKIVDLPIRYRERTYGDTNINRWSGGWLLLRMVVFAARRLKFV